MALDFVAFDVETAASRWDTICSVALVRVRDGRIVSEYSTLIDPECDFSPMNMRIHGITPESVRNSPVFPSAVPAILDFIGEDTLVAHNISFDANVLKKTFDRYHLSSPSIPIFCSLSCARAAFPDLGKYKLPDLCARFSISLPQHHEAGADARACAALLVAIARQLDADSLEDVCRVLEITPGSIDGDGVTLPTAPIRHANRATSTRPVAEKPVLAPEIVSAVEARVAAGTVPPRCPISAVAVPSRDLTDHDPAILCWEYGDKLRIQGDYALAIAFFDESRARGFDAPCLYDSYAKAFHKLKDYRQEIELIDEFLARSTYRHSFDFAGRREKALQKLQALLSAEEEVARKSAAREEARMAREAAKASARAEKVSRPRGPSGRPIDELTDDGTLVQHFQSIADAARLTGISSKSIRDAANGVQKHAGGYCWKYADS